MIDLHMITPAQANQAHEEIAKYDFKPFVHTKNAPHFVDYVINQVLVPLIGAENLLDGGYNIYTTNPGGNPVYSDTTLDNMTWADSAGALITTTRDEVLEVTKR